MDDITLLYWAASFTLVIAAWALFLALRNNDKAKGLLPYWQQVADDKSAPESYQELARQHIAVYGNQPTS